MRHARIIAGVLGLCLGVAAARGQTLQQRIDHLRSRRAAAPQLDLDQVLRRSVHRRLGNILDPVRIENATAREAFAWWARSTGISLVINWDAMVLDGVDPDTPIHLELRYVSAQRLLELLLRATAPPEAGGGVEFVYDVEPNYIHVLTKRQANAMPVTRVYGVLDLVMAVPYFDDAPSFDLREALSNTSSGGGGGGAGEGGLFGEDEQDRDEKPTTRAERGRRLAQLVRDSIEPTIWRENGGEFASIRYFDGRLIVTAPKYVQRRIGDQ